MPNPFAGMWMQAAAGAAQGGLAIGLQRLGLGYDYRKQFEQTRKLQELQLYNEGRLMDIQSQKQYEMWLKTNYGAQKEQMKLAGLNPALMYGMGGGGGTTMGGGMPSPPGSMAQDPNTRGAGTMGLMQGAQLALLNAQKENIEADTKGKIADAAVKGVQVANVEANTDVQKMEKTLKDQQQFEIGLRNALEQFRREYDENGKKVEILDNNSLAVKELTQRLQQTRQEIDLMQKQGKTQEEQQAKISQETQLLKNQVDWEALDITGDNIGKVISRILKFIFK